MAPKFTNVKEFVQLLLTLEPKIDDLIEEHFGCRRGFVLLLGCLSGFDGCVSNVDCNPSDLTKKFLEEMKTLDVYKARSGVITENSS